MPTYLKTFLKLSCALPLVGVAPVVFAGEAENFDEIVVTASRRPQPISEVGASISVIGEKAIAAAQYTFVTDALRSLPSVSVNSNGAFGGQAAVSIRGAGTGQTVILVDGVQLNDVSSPGGSFNFGTLDTIGIARIEVLKGPQAVLYGSDAIGGVVNIITKTGGEGFGGSVFGEYGAFDSFRIGGTAFGGTERVGFNLSASYSDTDGISKADGGTEKDGHENYTLRGRVTAQITDNFDLEAFGSYSDSETDVDGFGPTDDDGGNLALSEEYLLGARANISLLDGRFINTLSVEYSGIDRASVSAFGTFPGKGNRFNLDYLAVLEVTENWFVTAGAQHERFEAESVSEGTSQNIDSVFGVVSYENAGLNVSAGLRHDDHSVLGGTTNGQLRAAYNIAETGTKIFANWSEGFKAPSLFQSLFVCSPYCSDPQQIPRTDLDPERSEAWELGIEQSLVDGDVRIGATYFNQKTKDLIIFNSIVGYDNVPDAKSTGVEVFVDAQVGDSLLFSANYTYNDAKDVQADTRLIRRPLHKFYAAVNWTLTEEISTNASVTHNGAIDDTAGARVDDWTVVDLRVAYKVSENIELYGRVNNLFDADYQVITGYGTPGIASYFGIRANF